MPRSRLRPGEQSPLLWESEGKESEPPRDQNGSRHEQLKHDGFSCRLSSYQVVVDSFPTCFVSIIQSFIKELVICITCQAQYKKSMSFSSSGIITPVTVVRVICNA